MTTAIILAAGKSERMGANVDKAFLSLVNKPVVAWSLLAFERCADVDRIVLVVRKEQQLAAKAVAKMFGISKLDKVVVGGKTRAESVAAGFAACDADTRVVVVHDGARPLVKGEMVSEVVQAAKKGMSVALGRPLTDTLKRCAKGTTVTETVPRDRLWTVQTPQAFPVADFRAALKGVGKKPVTDDCQMLELAGVTTKIIESFRPNVKVTTPDDLLVASAMLR